MGGGRVFGRSADAKLREAAVDVMSTGVVSTMVLRAAERHVRALNLEVREGKVYEVALHGSLRPSRLNGEYLYPVSIAGGGPACTAHPPPDPRLHLARVRVRVDADEKFFLDDQGWAIVNRIAGWCTKNPRMVNPDGANPKPGYGIYLIMFGELEETEQTSSKDDWWVTSTKVRVDNCTIVDVATGDNVDPWRWRVWIRVKGSRSQLYWDAALWIMQDQVQRVTEILTPLIAIDDADNAARLISAVVTTVILGESVRMAKGPGRQNTKMSIQKYLTVFLDNFGSPDEDASPAMAELLWRLCRMSSATMKTAVAAIERIATDAAVDVRNEQNRARRESKRADAAVLLARNANDKCARRVAAAERRATELEAVTAAEIEARAVAERRAREFDSRVSAEIEARAAAERRATEFEARVSAEIEARAAAERRATELEARVATGEKSVWTHASPPSCTVFAELTNENLPLPSLDDDDDLAFVGDDLADGDFSLDDDDGRERGVAESENVAPRTLAGSHGGGGGGDRASVAKKRPSSAVSPPETNDTIQRCVTRAVRLKTNIPLTVKKPKERRERCEFCDKLFVQVAHHYHLCKAKKEKMTGV